MEVESHQRSVGFYTNRFVDAPDSITAQTLAIRMLRAERRFMVISSGLPSESVVVESVAQTSWWTSRIGSRQGFAFYPSEENVEPRGPANEGQPY